MNIHILSSADQDFSALSYNKRLLSPCPNIIFKKIDFQKGRNFNKLSNYRNFLETLKHDQFVILVDATDVICINPDLHKMYNDFLAMNSEIVFGAEKGTCYAFEYNSNQRARKECELWHKIYNLGEIELEQERPAGRTWLKNSYFLNSGMVCGYAGSIASLYNDVINGATKGHIDDRKVNFHNTQSDQICIYQTIFNSQKYHNKIISIDYESKLFHNVAPFKYDFDDKKILTGGKISNPYFVHFPGAVLLPAQIKQFKTSFGFKQNSNLLDFNLITSNI